MPILRFENVTKQFDSDSYGVREVNFSVDPGEFIFLTGPSGSGKTTLMRLLLREYPFSEGEIYFHDTPISSLKNRHVHLHRRRIGVVFQDYKLIPEMNVWENIALPLWVTGKSEAEVERRVTDLLNLIKLPEKALHFPSQLSGGEAQRVGIARALAVGPELVIADEPTGNLDAETAQHVARLLKKINELGTTVLIATHDKNIIASYPQTRTISLENGALIEDAPAEVSITFTVQKAKPSATQAKNTESEQNTKDTATKKRSDETDTAGETATQQDTKKEAANEAKASEDKETTTNKSEDKHAAHSEQRIAEDLIPPESKSKQTIGASVPWWKRFLGVPHKNSLDTDDTATNEETSEENSTTKASKDSHETISDDDLTTITEEMLDDDESIEEKHDSKSSKSSSSPDKKKTDERNSKSTKSEETKSKDKQHDKKDSKSHSKSVTEEKSKK